MNSLITRNVDIIAAGTSWSLLGYSYTLEEVNLVLSTIAVVLTIILTALTIAHRIKHWNKK